MTCGGGSSPTELEEMGSKGWGKKRVGDQVFVFDGVIELLYATSDRAIHFPDGRIEPCDNRSSAHSASLREHNMNPRSRLLALSALTALALFAVFLAGHM